MPVSTLHKPTLRALSYALAVATDSVEAVTVCVDIDETAELRRQWEDSGIDVTLKVVDSPYREIARPLVDYVRSLRSGPRDVVSVVIPEYVVGHWWQNLLHNQSALWLKSRLRLVPGVTVTSVPWRLASSAHAARRVPRPRPGAVRRGEPPMTPPSTPPR